MPRPTWIWQQIRLHSRPQRPRSFWSAPRIATSGQVQRHSGFEWICKHNRLRPEPIRFVRLDSEHAQSDGKSVNRQSRPQSLRYPPLDKGNGGSGDEVGESRTSVVGHGQRSRFLVLTKRSAACCFDSSNHHSVTIVLSLVCINMHRSLRTVQAPCEVLAASLKKCVAN